MEPPACPFCSSMTRDHCADGRCGWVMCTGCAAFGIPGTDDRWVPPINRVTRAPVQDDPQ